MPETGEAVFLLASIFRSTALDINCVGVQRVAKISRSDFGRGNLNKVHLQEI